jgi:hypothetical protein
MVDEGDANFNELLRKGINFKNTKKSRCILESVFKLVCTTERFDKAFIQEKPFTNAIQNR